MPLVSRIPGRAGVAALAAAIACSTVVLAPPSARAADPQVCVTGPVPTPETQPWYDFARTPNRLWEVRRQLIDMIGDIDAAAARLGPTSTSAAVKAVRDAVLDGPGAWRNTFEVYNTEHQSTRDVLPLLAALRIVAPETAQAAWDEVVAAYVAGVIPHIQVLDGSDGLVQTYIDSYVNALTSSYPLTGPVSIPSPDAVITGLAAVATSYDQWLDLGNAHVVLTSASAQTCATTASLSVPYASTTFGRATSVAVAATREGVPARGDLAVLLDGQQIGTASQVSSYVAQIPGDLQVGTHVLTVAFAPVERGPVSTASSTITVTKARTTTQLRLARAKVASGRPVRATITVAVPGTSFVASGTATVKVGRETVRAKISNGTGRVTLRLPRAGRYAVRASYAGTASFTTSRSPKVRLSIVR